jgi:hypothetical protein
MSTAAQSMVSPYLNVTSSDFATVFSRLGRLSSDTYYADNAFVETGFFSLLGDPEVADSDSDGVSDYYDLCANTEINTIVDTEGCETFSLPSDSFQIAVTHNPCNNSEEGLIKISTVLTSYEFLVEFNNQQYEWNSDTQELISFEALTSGTYSLCLSPKTVSSYKRCYEISITSPDPLEVQSKVLWQKQLVSLNLAGTGPYTIVHNDSIYKTNQTTEEIVLKSGLNSISVKGLSECLGSFEQEYFLSEEVRIFPNPVEDLAQIYIQGLDNKINLTLFDPSGKEIHRSEKIIPENRIVELPTNHLASGVYFLSLQSKSVKEELTLIKA